MVLTFRHPSLTWEPPGRHLPFTDSLFSNKKLVVGLFKVFLTLDRLSTFWNRDLGNINLVYTASLKKSENEGQPVLLSLQGISLHPLKMSGTLSPFQPVSSVLLLLAFEIAALVWDISYRYHKKLLQTSACVVLEARSEISITGLKPRCQQSHAPLRSCRGSSLSLPFPAPVSCLWLHHSVFRITSSSPTHSTWGPSSMCMKPLYACLCEDICDCI